MSPKSRLVSDGSLFLVAHVGLKTTNHGIQVDEQTAAGIAQWCKHFKRITYCGLAMGHAGTGNSATWCETGDGVLGRQVQFVALPVAYNPVTMAKSWRAAHTMLKSAIQSHQHLCFTLGNIVGDWPALGALEAIRQKRRYSVWIDRVEPQVIRTQTAHAPLRRLAAEVSMPVTQWAVRYLLRHSAIALLQGGDTYDWYASSAPEAHCIYDTHTRPKDRIMPEALIAKRARTGLNAPLRIIYAGRAVAMKGPYEWLHVLAGLRDRNIPFTATWMGDGPEIMGMRKAATRLGLSGLVTFPGAVDREGVLSAMRDSDLLLFCHQTLESARCLIEALVCGCPIAGFGSAYPRGLVNEFGGGAFVSRNDIPALIDAIAGLHADRHRLADLIVGAARSGELFDEDDVYAHRARLMARG